MPTDDTDQPEFDDGYGDDAPDFDDDPPAAVGVSLDVLMLFAQGLKSPTSQTAMIGDTNKLYQYAVKTLNRWYEAQAENGG